MKKPLRRLLIALFSATLLLAAWRMIQLPAQETPPLLGGRERTLLRIWVLDAPGGAVSWLRGQLRAFEKGHPQVSTYLRQVSAEDLTAEDALLPDILLYMPGNLQQPQAYFLPLTGSQQTAIREPLLRCGRWQGAQYGLPLCWGAWVLALDSALEPGEQVTPEPTTLLGRTAATPIPADATPRPYPLEAASPAACALHSPGGAALFTLAMLLTEYPPLPDDLGTLDPAQTYAAFQKRQCASAMLTTGQLTAFAGLVSSGGGFPFRAMTADEIITDQVWLGSVTSAAPPEAALLLAHLVSPASQKALGAQGLHTVRDDLTLYASGTSAAVELAGRSALSAINAYLPQETVRAAAWQFFHGRSTLDDALLPLL